MKTWGVAITVAALVCGSLFYIVGVVLNADSELTEFERLPEVGDARMDRLEATVGELAAETAQLGTRPPAASKDAPVVHATGVVGSLAQRFEKVEKEIVELRRTIENLVPATEAVEIEYADPTSFEHIDRYFDEGKFATAAGAYLKFLEHHPNHPDTLDMMRKARDAYRRAGYGARAVDVQKSLLADYPVEDRDAELRTLGNLEKRIKRYEDAIAHMDEAAQATGDTQQRLVALAYRAWYIELGRGPEAGLAANREVHQFAQEVGMDEYNVAKNVQQHVERLQKVVAAGSR